MISQVPQFTWFQVACPSEEGRQGTYAMIGGFRGSLGWLHSPKEYSGGGQRLRNKALLVEKCKKLTATKETSASRIAQVSKSTQKSQKQKKLTSTSWVSQKHIPILSGLNFLSRCINMKAGAVISSLSTLNTFLRNFF